jgi:hypothetical protein
VFELEILMGGLEKMIGELELGPKYLRSGVVQGQLYKIKMIKVTVTKKYN